MFEKAGLKPLIRMELGNNESIKQGVSGGLGLAVLSMHTLTSGDFSELAILDVEGFPISWQWYVGHPKGKNLSIVARTFIDYMYREGMSLLPEEIRSHVKLLSTE
jgi:DNA-binding transcriptional LysR family regulator